MKNETLSFPSKGIQHPDVFSLNFLYEKFLSLQKQQNTIHIALSGGSTPLPILAQLKDRELDWEKFSFFLVDERCVPTSHADSNYGNIDKIFFSKINAQVFSAVKDGLSMQDSVVQYKQEMVDHLPKVDAIPQFDCILLGMGTDGHIASLFPETEALNEENEIVVLNKVPQLDTQRITLTYPVLLNAKEIIFLLKGEEKLKILEEAQMDAEKYPVGKIIHNHPNTTILSL